MSSTLRQKISKWWSYHVSFSMAALCISGVVFSHAFVEYAILSVLINFMAKNWEDYNFPKAAAIVNAQEGLSILMAVMVAYFAEYWLGRFNAIVTTMAAFITGLLLLLSFHSSNTGIFYVAVIVLLTLGKGGRSPTLNAFIYDQFDPEHNAEMAEARSQFCWLTAWFLGAIAAIVVWSLVASGDWAVLLIMNSAIITGVAYWLFLLGIRFYKTNPPTHTITYKMIQWRKLLRLVPLWITFLIYSLAEAAGTTFFLEQSSQLKDQIGNYKIPICFFIQLQSLTKFIISNVVDFLISKLWKEENRQRRARAVRIGIGMFVSILCCLTAREVELRRLELIKKSSNEDGDGIINMHILWLTPQYFLLGSTAGLVEEGLEQFFYDHVPESMKLYELPFNEIVLGLGKFVTIIFIAFICKGWFDETIDTSKLDRYYLMLAMLSLAALLFFTLAVYSRDWKISPDRVPDDSILEKGLVLQHQTLSTEIPSGSGETIDRPTRTTTGLVRFRSSRSFNGERPRLTKSYTNQY